MVKEGKRVCSSIVSFSKCDTFEGCQPSFVVRRSFGIHRRSSFLEGGWRARYEAPVRLWPSYRSNVPLRTFFKRLPSLRSEYKIDQENFYLFYPSFANIRTCFSPFTDLSRYNNSVHRYLSYKYNTCEYRGKSFGS